MKQDPETATKDADASRREILTSFAGVMAVGLGLEGEKRKNISPSTDSTTHTMPRRTSRFQNSQRSAYVALPALTGDSLLANLPYLMSKSQETPAIIMDIHDYKRIRGWAERKKGDEPWLQNLVMGYDQLHQQNVILFKDYSKFYPKDDRAETIQKNRIILDKVDDKQHTDAAVEGAGDVIDYSRGEYQKRFCIGLGENLADFKDARRMEEGRQRTLNRGGGTPEKWNERTLNQYIAALKVQKKVDEKSNLDVKGIIGEGESKIINKILSTAESNHQADASHIKRLNPTDNIETFSSEVLAPTRETLDKVSEQATKMTRVQHDDWTFLTPLFAIPQCHDFIKTQTVQNQLERRLDPSTLIEEATDVVDTLQNRAEEAPTLDNSSYEVEKIAEEENILESESQWDLGATADYAVDLAHYSDELRALVDNDVSQAAALVGVSVVSDPSTGNDTNAVEHHGKNLIKQFNPPSVNQERLTAFRRRTEVWDENVDWYETAKQVR